MSIFENYINNDENKVVKPGDVIFEDGEDVIEPLNEITVFSDQRKNRIIIITPDTKRAQGFTMDPYFKVLNAKSYDKATECIRIHMFNPIYEYHKGDGKGHMKYNKELGEYLKTTLLTPGPEGGTLFDKLRALVITFFPNASAAEINYINNTPPTDFTNLKEKGK